MNPAPTTAPRPDDLDPQRLLQEAAELRSPCEIILRKGGLVRATVVRVEKGGVVLDVIDHRFLGGEDVRVWVRHDDTDHTFDASVIRAGVPVPDRGHGGILLGFIDRWTQATPATDDSEGCAVELVPSGGPAIPLHRAPARLVRVAVDGLSFAVPADFKMVFVEQGEFEVRLVVPGQAPVIATARVCTLSADESFVLYDLRFEAVSDHDAHREAVEVLSGRF